MTNLLSRLRLTGWLTWLSILVLAAGPRLAGLDGFVTADEVRWTCRTSNFREALLRGDWAATFQTGHPGVITMWLGSLMLPADPGAEVTRACHELNPGQIAEFEPWAVRSQLYHLLVAARGPVALALVLGVVAIYALARRLFGPTTAWLGAILIALDPFLLAHSRVLHLDGPLATLMTVSVLALLAAMLGGGVGGREGGTVRRPATAGWHGQETGHSKGWHGQETGHSREFTPTLLLVSGATAGLAALAKAPGMFLGPLAVAALVLMAPTRGRRRTVSDLVLWSIAAGVTFFIAWPALWADPAGTFTGMLAKASGYVVEAEKSTSFFLGRLVDDPGPAFYPILFLLRASPVMLIGLVAVVAVRRPATAEGGRQPGLSPLLALVAYALLFGAFMTIGEKKFDRYLLPAFPPLDLVAAAGLVGLAERARARVPRFMLSAPVVALGAGLIQGLLVLPFFPYFLSFYNPLLGGGATAVRLTLVGWGEGLDQAAAYLNAQPGAADLRALGWGATMGPLFVGRTLRTTDANRAVADYVVIYVSDVQAGKPQAQPLTDYQPEYVVRIHGIDYAWIYRNPDRALRPDDGLLDDSVELLGWNVTVDDGFKTWEAGGSPVLMMRKPAFLQLELYWQARRPLAVSYTVFTHLLDAHGRLVGQHDGLPAGGDEPTTKWRPGQAVADRHNLAAAPDVPPGEYWFEVGLYRAETGERLGDRLRLGPVRLEEAR
jgi:4-amino-4-deoxy-L-arabinose transferase-like glycosyltransferase